MYWLPPEHTPTGDRTQNLGVCPDGGSNPQRFGVWDDTATNGATGQGGT